MSADKNSSPTAAAPAEASGAKVEQLGVYWSRSNWDLARSAYVADLDTDPTSPAVFAGWLARVIEQHVARTPAARAKIADQVPESGGVRGSSRGHRVGRAVIDALEDAIVQDRLDGRTVSRSAFVIEAVHAAGEAARTRLGRPLPPPPAKLGYRPPRRRV